LTTQDQAAGVRVYYQRYEAVLAAQKKFEKLHKAGKWDASFHPTQDNFIALITSRSMWYNFYKKNFDKLPRYEVMREWLLETSEATDLEIWGFERTLYQWGHLQDYFARDGKPLEVEVEEDESDDDKPQKKKKTHKKVKVDKKKDKGKARAKEVASEEESSESDHQSRSKKPSGSRKK
jgi:hypothetical protein